MQADHNLNGLQCILPSQKRLSSFINLSHQIRYLPRYKLSSCNCCQVWMPGRIIINNLVLSASTLGSFIPVTRNFPHQPMQQCKFYCYHLLQMITLNIIGFWVLQMICKTLFYDAKIPIMDHITKMRVHTRSHQIKLILWW